MIILVRRKVNYTGFTEIEKELFRVARAAEKKEISASVATVMINSLKLWLKTRETKELDEFEKRLAALEGQKKTEVDS